MGLWRTSSVIIDQLLPARRSFVSSSHFDIDFSVPCTQRLRFTEDVLAEDFAVFRSLLEASGPAAAKVQLWVDRGVFENYGEKLAQFEQAIRDDGGLNLTLPMQTVIAGEACKRQPAIIETMWSAFNRTNMDRRSYVVAIGGGAVLDAVGYATATAHRGLRIIRLPTTTLSQADSGVGVKNAINYFDKKNWLGTFAVPWAVINDLSLIAGLPDRDFRCGFSEAVKVSLLKSSEAFDDLCENADQIRGRDLGLAQEAIRFSIMAHLRHITEGGDPFEAEMARPLDFGHWSAHKLEAMTEYQLRHGEAVSIGVALDCLYSARVHGLRHADALRVVRCLADLGLPTSHPLLGNKQILFDGLEEFRQHLGGELTITMLDEPGLPLDVHEIDFKAMADAIDELVAISEDPE